MGVTIRQKVKGKGNAWWVFISHEKKRTSKMCGDKQAAEEVASIIRAQLKLGNFDFEKPKPVPTFKEHAELWMALPHDWKESTREIYRDHLNNYIYPVFGKTPVNEIRRSDLKIFFKKLLSEGKASKTIGLIRAPISGVLSDALDCNLIEHNPVVRLKLIQTKSKLEIVPLSKEDVILLLKSAQEYEGGVYYPSILLALRTGMRIGEIKALKWKDIDFENRLIEVRRSCRKERITKPKNGKTRRVDMTPHLADTLKTLQTTQKKNALQKGRPFSEWVFANTRGTMMRYKSFKKALMDCLKAAGLLG